jgi:hypothetical protein
MLVDCETCEARVDAAVLHQEEVWEPELGMDTPERYTLVRCRACASVMLAREEYLVQDWEPPVRVYPALRKASWSLPTDIRVSFEETLAVLAARAYTATAMMCRRTLEGVCVNQGADGATLQAMLGDLKQKGVIEQRLYDWADSLRDAGNGAAHDVDETVSAEDARDLVDLTEAVLQYVFTFQAKYNRFKQRRKPSTP